MAHEGATLLSLAAAVFGGRPHQVPRGWQRLVRDAAAPDAGRVLRPLFAPKASLIPDCLAPTASMGRGDAATHLERLADLSPDVLLTELERDFPAGVPPQWRPVVDRPRAWIAAHARVMRGLGGAFAPVWRAADGLLARETERVGVAAVHEALGPLLAGLSPRFPYRDGTLHLPDPRETDFRLGDRSLVLVPLVTGPGAALSAVHRHDLVWVGYPVPGLARLWDSPAAPPAPAPDGLTALVGTARAALLRELHAHPTMGELSALLTCTPATTTYHCRQLEAAGLVVRDREGRTVRVRPTARAERLLALFG
ncbi:helix-turn-helix domain-containing protein [Streptomyces sp. NPDC049881]|uniref:helix-turn-helix domain-containing protein n=1 Tax=Streptomyces sp. NPDC049881 TaxID=3155778 RepID=UPI00342B809B